MADLKLSVSELVSGDEAYMLSEWGIVDKVITRPDGLCAVVRDGLPTVYVNAAKMVTVRRNSK
jgi:hypothetical protein